MSKYKSVNTAIINELKSIVGEKYVWTDPDKLEPYSHDEVMESKYKKTPEVVVLPRTAEEISKIVKLANQELIPVVPRGAGTGLACGAVAFYGGIILSTERMNQILEIDEQNLIMVTEPGVRTVEVQKAANDKGLFYAGDPCSGDSSFIGGNIATNAGGNKAVKYGTTRQQVAGIEIVTPEGDIVTLGGKLKKDSTGYCLTQLIAGSEGTLGIITKAYLKLSPLPKHEMHLLAIFPSAESAINIVPKIMHSGIIPTCVEFMDNKSVRCCEEFLEEKLPRSESGHYIIITIDGDNETVLEDQCVLIDELCTTNGGYEVLVADPNKIWKARKSFAEADRARSLILSAEDIVVPPSKITDIIKKIDDISKKYDVRIHCAAHAADGNVHAEILKENMDIEQWNKLLPLIQHEIYQYVYSLGGKLSGEHGIGYKRLDLMEEFANPVELKMMKAIKRALDPNNIMNPGKIVKV
ncbi:FAD linked oxidase domain protein [Thermosinus carboxydivorans Nor1]|uniref:FAD linked oxidase domain protein n=1 Tax=Thermosinus carboxydivorans Nor1 TaxID=401526 RepID=A1HPH4_9FIRM|nr:FAD-binding oxidoreductase [Thermosinus carboxydivorans]EAX47950.1 FAD linked oxidase domain protein [Thermosinus carboxydivorans Nor1]